MKREGAHKTKIEKRNGTIQTKRLDSNLLNTPFQIDGRSSWDILAYIANYLEKINYYTLENRVDGNWKKFAEKDTLIFIASIINYPTDGIDNLIKTYDKKKVEEDPFKRREVIVTLGQWWRRVNQWSANLEALNEKNLAEKINNSLVNGVTFNRDYIQIREGKIDIANLLEAAQKAKDIGDILDEILHDFQKAIAHIKETAKHYFERNVLSSNQHLPHNAMYIAFTLLYQKIQEKLNGLSKRHLDFYYKDVLHLGYQEGEPTRAIVNFDLQPMVSGAIIPKGTRLSAGKILGSATDILFKTTKNLRAYQCELVNIQTLFINSNKYIKVGTDAPIISSINYTRLLRYSEEQLPRDKWYVFGANKKTVLDSKVNEQQIGKLGCIIGSPVLFLSEGKREIDLRFNLEEKTSQTTFWKLLNEIKCHKNISLRSVVAMVFNEGFTISYTNKKGWITCESYLIEVDQIENQFTIKIVLDMTHPSLEVGVDIKEELTWPSIKLELNEYAPVYVYSFLKEVEVDTIDIDVSVQKIKNLSLYNTISKMPLGKPIELFGPEPQKGSYVMIGHSELFKKQINTLEVQLDWDTIPSDYGGFEKYYEGYSTPIDNDTFKIQFSTLSNGYWLPQKSNPAITKNLFTMEDCITPEGYNETRLQETSLLEFDTFKELGIAPDYTLQDPLLYTVNSRGGYIKMSLVGSDIGFGSEIYQKDFLNIATYNAKNKKQLPFPNKPYVPKIKGVSINYKASDTLSFVEKIVTSDTSSLYEGEFKHIKPYMVEDVIVDQLVKKHTLLPDFKQEGYLILGIKGAQGGTDLNIYFNFLRSSTTINIKDNSLTWEYLSSPDWKKFEPSAIIRDNTEGFIKSGIVQLIVPYLSDEQRGNNSSILWIRASTRDDVENYPKIKGIYLNAVEAVCMNNDPTLIGKKIKSNAIHKIDGKLPDVKRVHQAAETFGGRPPEEESQYYTRISERLRHKGRAVTLWDYERLLLEKFPDILIAKCTSFNEHFNPVPGHVKVVVLSKRWTTIDPYYYSKMALKRMKDFLNSISSSFIDIEVINPRIERLLVNCKVLFDRIDAGRNYRQKLSEDITRFLSPIDNMGPNYGGIGGSIMPSTISNYIENIPYVKRLEKFNVEHIVSNKEEATFFELDVHQKEKKITAETPWSILAPVGQHRIITRADIDEIEEVKKLEVGLGLLGIGVDFIIGDEH